MAWEEPRKTGMQYRSLGNSGLHVSVLGLGGWLTYVLGWRLRVIANDLLDLAAMSRMVKIHLVLIRSHILIWSRAELTFSCMKQAYDCGINFFDTAER